MTKIFIQRGNTFFVQDREQLKTFDDLPVATYTVKFNDMTGEFFLETIADFEIPSKIYGKSNTHANRILQTFESRPLQTGVLLSGIKGAGKTLLAKQVSVMAVQRGYPTIVINKPWTGDEFNSFVQSITTPAVIIFDEFEKVYDWHEQRKILTLFDGVFSTKKLFVVTTNDHREVSEFMTNRPGRMYYNLKFDTLGIDFIEEYLNDKLDNKTRIPEILKYAQVFNFFNFDMLVAAVEEMNRYNESLSDVLQVLNITPENRTSDTYTVSTVVNGIEYEIEKSFSGFNPSRFEYSFWVDDDMPDNLFQDPEARRLVRKAVNYVEETSDSSLPQTNISSNNEVAAHSENRYDTIRFDQTNIEMFDDVNNRFVYGVSLNGVDIKLYIKRNVIRSQLVDIGAF